MKTFASDAQAAIEAGSVVVGGAVKIDCDPPVLAFYGSGTIDIDGDTYVGIGYRGLAQVTNAALGSAAQNITLTLSGIDPDVLPLLDADELAGAAVQIWRLISDSSGLSLLDAQVYDRGRVDQVTTQDVIGSTAIINVLIEGAARGLGRRGGRMRTDADQRLITSGDGSFKSVSYAAEKTLYWGSKPPARAGDVFGNIFQLVVHRLTDRLS